MRKSSGKRVLVAGGAGFLGSHLCDRLLSEGHRVLALDDLSTGSRSNLEHLRLHPRFALRVHDVTRPLPPGLDADGIFNLACPASPSHYQREPVQTTLTCVLGAWQLLDVARRCGARLLQTSTSEIYGDPAVHPQAEDYRGNVNPIGPRACYDEGKRCAETLCFAYLRQHQTPVRIVRIFNTYGPRMQPSDGRVVSNFIVQALRGENLTVYGNGEQTRSFCYIDDLIEGMRRMMDADAEGPVNLGNPEEHTVRELAERVIELTGSRSKIVRHPLPADDPKRRKPDIRQAQRLLGWQPRVSLEEGLQETIAWFRERLGLPPQRRTFLPAAAAKADEENLCTLR